MAWSLAVALSIACSTNASGPAPAPDRVTGWRTDLRMLDSLVPALHPPTEADPGFAAFHASLATLSSRVSELSDGAVLAGIQKALVAIGDGHTTVIPNDYELFPFLALMVDFYWFDDGVYVVSVRPGLAPLFGGKVISIGGVPVAELMSRLAPLVPRDNAQSLRWLGAQLMQYDAVLRACGVEIGATGTSIEYLNTAGQTVTTLVGAHTRNALDRLHPPGGESEATPRYLRKRSTPYWIESLDADRTLYVNFNSVRDDPAESLSAFAARVGALLQQPSYTSVIVDVRLNNGGNNTLLAPLLDVLRAFDQARPANRLFVLTGRATFSAGQNFATRLEQSTRAVFVGEATGGRPNHIGDESAIPLPYSGITVSIASRRYDDAGPGDTRSTLTPSVVISVLAADYFGNRDPAFDAVMGVIRGQGSGLR
jgi:hypothetical protein